MCSEGQSLCQKPHDDSHGGNVSGVDLLIFQDGSIHIHGGKPPRVLAVHTEALLQPAVNWRRRGLQTEGRRDRQGAIRDAFRVLQIMDDLR